MERKSPHKEDKMKTGVTLLFSRCTTIGLSYRYSRIIYTKSCGFLEYFGKLLWEITLVTDCSRINVADLVEQHIDQGIDVIILARPGFLKAKCNNFLVFSVSAIPYLQRYTRKSWVE